MLVQAAQAAASVEIQSAVAEAEEELRLGHEATMASLERKLTAAK